MKKNIGILALSSYLSTSQEKDHVQIIPRPGLMACEITTCKYKSKHNVEIAAYRVVVNFVKFLLISSF